MQTWIAVFTIIAAIGTVAQAWIARAVFRHAKRVDALAGVVQEMANQTKVLAAQTKVLSDGYQLQLELSKRERMPVLRLTSKVVRKLDDKRSLFIIQNVGMAAHNLDLPNKEEFVTFEIINRTGGPKSYGGWKFFLNTLTPTDFDLVFTYITDDDRTLKQEIMYMDGDLSLDAPIDITENFDIVP